MLEDDSSDQQKRSFCHFLIQPPLIFRTRCRLIAHFLVKKLKIVLSIDLRSKIRLLIGRNIIDEPIDIFPGSYKRLCIVEFSMDLTLAGDHKFVVLSLNR